MSPVTYESLILGTDMSSPLELNDGAVLTLGQLALPPAQKKPQWIDGRDGPILVDEEMAYDSADVPCVVQVERQASMDLATAKVGLLIDMLQEAERRGSIGLPCSYTPATGTTTYTWYLQLGQITNLPVDWESGWLAFAPALQVSMTRRPFFYKPEVTGPTATDTKPVIEVQVDHIPGDVSAEGRFVVTDGASQTRRFGEWGLENYYVADEKSANGGTNTPYILDSDNLVTTGFTGTGSTQSGAYDPNASGNNVIAATLTSQATAVCGTGTQKHIGSFRVRARIWSTSIDYAARLSWQDADGPFRSNSYSSPPIAGWCDLDLGVITIAKADAGAQSWSGRVEAYSPSGAQIKLDYVRLIPVGQGYGKVAAVYNYVPGAVVASDAFTGISGGTALNGRTADAGGNWATSGAATDLSADGSGREQRNATGIRFAILGTTIYSDVEVGVDRNANGFFGDQGVVARWVDSSNYLVAYYNENAATFTVAKVVAGVTTFLAGSLFVTDIGLTLTKRVRLVVPASGTGFATLVDSSGGELYRCTFSDAVLAPGGTLDDGKAGFYHGGAGGAQWFDNFTIATPAPEPVFIYSGRTAEFRSDRAIRQDSGGTKYGDLVPRGSHFFLPAAGNADRSSRIAFSARRQNIDENIDDGVTDSTTIAVFYRSRHLVPR